jgi:rhodanese-related sulfurtransferase
MAWLLAGRELAHGRAAPLPEPGERARDEARSRAHDVAERAGVRRIDATALARLEAEGDERSLFRFDVRTRQEYEAGHLEGWRWAPGGQLVQATDEYVGTRRARIVLADWDGVRALTTGAWLAQLGGHEVFVFSPPALPVLVLGPEPVRVLPLRAATAPIATGEAATALEAGTAVAFDIERRAAYERGHVAGARFAVPDRLEALIAELPASRTIVLLSSDGVLASVVAAELAARTGRPVRALAGGTRAWIAEGRATGSGSSGVLTGDDDHWYSPYAHADLSERDAGFKRYLDWEIGLVAQLEREGDVGMRLVEPARA